MADFRPVNLAEIYGAADQANMNRMRMDAYQRQAQQEQTALDQQKALKGAYAVGPDGELDEKTTLANLYRVAPEKAYEFKQGMQKSKIEMADAQSKQAKSALEQNAAVLKYGRDRLSQVTNQQEYDAWIGEMNQIGAPFAKSLSPQYSPETQQKYLLTADDALKQATPKYERVDLGGKIQVIDVNPFTNPAVRNMQLDKTQTPDSVASTRQQELNRNVTIRGQNMTDARAKEKNQIDASGNGYSTKPLPPTALKMQNEALDKLSISSNNNERLGKVLKQIEDGKLNLGPLANLEGTIRNQAGMSTESSRNLSSFKSTLEKLRNDSLRLNTGVQTDGDAQRAWNELFENINDKELVKQRLKEIQEINKRGADLQKLQVENIRGNYNAAPIDFGKYEPATNPKSPENTPPTTPKTNYDALPKASEVPNGAIITDTVSGKRLKAVNGKWVNL